MFGSKYIKWVLVSLVVVGLTACGGGSSSNDIPSTPSNAAPTADAGADQTVNGGEPVDLDGSGSTDPDGTIVAYEWKEGMTVLSTAVSFTKSNFSVGTHTLTLTVTDNDGATGTDDVNITVVSLIKKTGQTLSYDAIGDVNASIKDDGFYQAGRTPSYSRDDVNNTVTDNITKLMWQDDDNGTVSGGSSPAMNWTGAKAHCTALTLGGYNDWRLPTNDELMYIADRSSVTGKAIDTTVFVNAVANHYWSSSPVTSASTYAWSTDFSNGNDNWDLKTTTLFVRCVRTLP